MYTFVSYKNFSDFVAYYAKNKQLPVYPTLTRFASPITSLNSWGDMAGMVAADSLFGGGEDEGDIYDYSGLQIDAKISKYIAEMPDKNAFFINRDEPTLSAASKKIVASDNTRVVEIKAPNKDEIREVMDEFETAENFKLSTDVKNYITNKSANFDSLLSYLHIAFMSENSLDALREYETVEKPALFVLPWRGNTLKSDAAVWYRSVGDEELQMALSLLMTKTLKWPPSKIREKVIAQIVQLDADLKTYTRSDMTRFKSFLWSVAFEN